MSSRNMCLLPRPTLRRDREQILCINTYLFLSILQKFACVVIKGFLEAARTHVYESLKVARYLMKKSAKDCHAQSFYEPFYMGTKKAFRHCFIIALASL
jgi:hypothetical protein